jgi:hypothetical protein
MSGQAIVPMMFDDGSVRQVPVDKQGDAYSAGGKHVAKMGFPDGSLRWVPHDVIGDAIQSGGQFANAVPRSPMQEKPPSTGEQILSTLGKTGKLLAGMIAGQTNQFVGIPNIPQAADTALSIMDQPTTTSKIAAAVGGTTGLVNVRGVTEGAQKAGATGDYSDLAANTIAPVAAVTAAGRLGGLNKVGPSVTDVATEVARSDMEGQPLPAPRDPISSLSSVIAKGSKVDAYETVKPVIGDLQKAAAQIGEDVTATRNPVQGLQRVAQQALNNHEEVFQPIVQKYADQIVSGKPIAAALTEKADSVRDANPQYAAKLEAEAAKFNRDLNIAELDKIRGSLNRGDATAITSEAAGAIRNLEYGKLQELSGQDLAMLKMKESNLITFKQQAQKAATSLSNQQARFDSLSPVKRFVQNVAQRGAVKGTVKTVLSKSPAQSAKSKIQEALGTGY